ncbi:MAG: DM13 domain-containing protein [Phycisphaerales bacterium]|nr:DM13 domain-containing protein [Phycisphaerales bacterium]
MISTLAAAVIAASTMMSAVTLSTDTLVHQSRTDSVLVQQATTVTDSGSMWKKGKYPVSGAFRFEERDDGTYLVIESDFKTKKGPDLKFVLSPTDYTSVKAKTALKGGLIVGKLKSFTGAQEFKLPAGTNASSYKSLLVHCEAKTKLWGSAPINSGNLIVHGSSWQKKASKITGHWEIAKTDAGLVLRLGSDFKTKKMPDLLLILSPMDMKSINGKNAANGGIEFATLSNTKGQSEYLIKGADSLDGYKSLVIHCEEYSKCWGGTAIN